MKTNAKCPLYLHGSGQWAKTIGGKKYYFGKDKEAAIDKYLAEKDFIATGRIRPTVEGATLAELGNLYADWGRQRVASDDLAQRTLDESIKTLGRLMEIRGKDDRPNAWDQLDYAAIKEEFSKPIKRTAPIRGKLIIGPTVKRRSQVTVDGDLRRIRAFLNWAHDCELINQPKYGKVFDQASAKTKRKLKAKAGRRDLSADDLRLIIENCSPYLKPLVMLGINAGMGAADLARMELSDYDGGEWLDYARGKTGVERRVWLWPETRLAIAEFLHRRLTPFGAENANLLFHTKARSSWMRGTQDAVGKAFQKARESAGLDRGSFYDLRRTFQTVAEGTLDFPAISHVMGHSSKKGDMAAQYRQGISDDRIRRVCEHVRDWLYGVEANG